MLAQNNLNQGFQTLSLREQAGLQDRCALVFMGVGLRHLFCVWNRSYKLMCFVAQDQHEALHLAVAHRHLRRAQFYRRFEDVTERALQGDEEAGFGDVETVKRALEHGTSGMWKREDGEWLLNGQQV